MNLLQESFRFYIDMVVFVVEVVETTFVFVSTSGKLCGSPQRGSLSLRSIKSCCGWYAIAPDRREHQKTREGCVKDGDRGVVENFVVLRI